MLTIGLIGGIASGKSAVAQAFVKLGAVVLDADRAGHAVLREPPVIATLVDRWGPGILTSDGQVSRSAVAKIVFAEGSESERLFLNRLTHPLIAEKLKTELNLLQSEGHPAAILDAALLLEAGWDRLCDRVLFVDAPQSARLERAKGRGWDAAELARREATQLPLGEKKQRSTAVIENGGTLDDLNRQVKAFWLAWIPTDVNS
ncbi:Dephospho-CoA kinase [Anatilimnocola aggregata]|uniref:Dephospho-CoA kinase n=1 Tax=Anatilimnocola aggregata TaxID=2528021 RepID=A0A517YEU6_9BACT|nr:dephospho-CoA kinase [Anatilimnocola aggregata]QDU28731.1 Dephospho-CoA kinase [Anatilimnocola aggregata]